LAANFNIEKILIAPLDWGLGHATRCVPIIKALLDNGYEVMIAAEGKQAFLLRNEFPALIFFPLKGYGINYSKSKRLLPLKMLMQIPKILSAVKHEHDWLDKIIDQHKIDLVISDNRYGLYSKKVPCVFITHQLTIKMPFAWLEKLVQKVNYKYINRFATCWVPDLAGEKNVAGILSHPLLKPTIPVHYLNLLSRFDRAVPFEKKYGYCILLSGPEPQRTLLEERILKSIDRINENFLLIRGLPGSNAQLSLSNNIEVKNHLAGKDLQQAIMQSDFIISRSGYTTVMELLSLQKKSILIPTSGQTEQEYLGERLMNQGWSYSVSQDDFELIEAIESAKQFNYSFPSFESNNLQILIPQLVENLQR